MSRGYRGGEGQVRVHGEGGAKVQSEGEGEGRGLLFRPACRGGPAGLVTVVVGFLLRLGGVYHSIA